jgi:hypothetical protein
MRGSAGSPRRVLEPRSASFDATLASTTPASPDSVRDAIRELPLDVEPSARRGPLAGSALSPDTWRQTLESLRDLTARSR